MITGPPFPPLKPSDKASMEVKLGWAYKHIEYLEDMKVREERRQSEKQIDDLREQRRFLCVCLFILAGLLIFLLVSHLKFI